MNNYEPIKRRKLSHEIVDRLLDMFNRGELKENDKMPSERELMERYAVGRPAVREALLTLENMGLISIQHGEKARVKNITAEDVLGQIDSTTRHLLSNSSENIQHLREARHVFEAGVVILAAQKASSSCIAKLKEKLELMRDTKGNRAEFVKHDVGFHSTIAEMSGNPIIQAVSTAMFNWLSESHRDYERDLLGVPELEELTLKEHEGIFECISKGDAMGAAKSISDHILRVNKLYSHTTNEKECIS
ncbi:MAG: transcriptional regulator NanR [Desulfobacterales bacterium]